MKNFWWKVRRLYWSWGWVAHPQEPGVRIAVLGLGLFSFAWWVEWDGPLFPGERRHMLDWNID